MGCFCRVVELFVVFKFVGFCMVVVFGLVVVFVQFELLDFDVFEEVVIVECEVIVEFFDLGGLVVNFGQEDFVVVEGGEVWQIVGFFLFDEERVFDVCIVFDQVFILDEILLFVCQVFEF